MDELIEKLRSVKWEVIDDDDWDSRCVFVDMRPDDFEALLTEAAAVLEAARKDGWQPIETAPKPDIGAAQPKRRPYNASGSLSEYGILPECDAATAAQLAPGGPYCKQSEQAAEIEALRKLEGREQSESFLEANDE